MLSYNLTDYKGPIYQGLYQFILNDIISGKLKADEKLPSKRTFARNLGISTISVENAYDQLISEGYIYSVPKSGYFVSRLESPPLVKNVRQAKDPDINFSLPDNHNEEKGYFDFSSNSIENCSFPFSIWARLLRQTISQKEKELLELSPCSGVKPLREAIANHLMSFRGMKVNPAQIIVGAGTEYLYGLLIKLLGNDKIYCIENPGYKKLKQIYESNNAACIPVDMDEKGLSVEKLREAQGQIAHISPTHHFPTGTCMSSSRRYEMLAWANENENNYIIEDDYDSEFRLKGKPVPPLFCMDLFEKVIYMNTFSKSLTSTIRISYMILPQKLAETFYKRLAFYSCTVSTFEQYTLASFISEGYFEKHINRMRLHYGRKRERIIALIKKKFSESECRIIENDSGLHFILQFNTSLSDQKIKERLKDRGILISSITEFQMKEGQGDTHQFIFNYSGINMQEIEKAIAELKESLRPSFSANSQSWNEKYSLK